MNKRKFAGVVVVIQVEVSGQEVRCRAWQASCSLPTCVLFDEARKAVVYNLWLVTASACGAAGTSGAERN